MAFTGFDPTFRRRAGVKAIIFILAFILSTAAAFAQQPEPSSTPPEDVDPTKSPIRIPTDLITLTATVTDVYGRYVSGLNKNAFLIYDNNQEQEITFFSDSDVAGMSIDLSGWTFAVDEGKLTLTLSAETTWKENDEISFEITGVESSAQPSSGDSEIGTVRVTLDTKTDRMLPIHATAEFDLVWANYEATIDWAVTLNSSDDLTLTGDSSGSVTAATMLDSAAGSWPTFTGWIGLDTSS